MFDTVSTLLDDVIDDGFTSYNYLNVFIWNFYKTVLHKEHAYLHFTFFVESGMRVTNLPHAHFCEGQDI